MPNLVLVVINTSIAVAVCPPASTTELFIFLANAAAALLNFTVVANELMDKKL